MLRDNSWPKNTLSRQGLNVWRLNRLLSIFIERIQTLSEDGREIPIIWSIMHMFGTVQLAKLLALKRGIDPELAALTSAFHDIYTLHTGLTENHATLAKKYIIEIIKEYDKRRGKLPEITGDEVERIIRVVDVHGKKHNFSDDPLKELLKDVDSLDAFLSGLSDLNLKKGQTTGRLLRTNNTLKDFGINLVVEK